MECMPFGYVECLDGHNYINTDAIDLKFESNIVKDIWIGINILDCDQMIGKLEMRRIIIW